MKAKRAQNAETLCKSGKNEVLATRVGNLEITRALSHVTCFVANAVFDVFQKKC